VTLTIDHRVLDGYAANAFLDRWVAVIEGWR
jgi:pyruvate/2-oxoglutarate dehydrogenase complex dihydrolipoamide acyltransferase (E2) component